MTNVVQFPIKHNLPTKLEDGPVDLARSADDYFTLTEAELSECVNVVFDHRNAMLKDQVKAIIGKYIEICRR